MSSLIFAVWAVLLGGQAVRHLDAAIEGCTLGTYWKTNIKSCENVTWSDLAPTTCKDVRGGENRTVVKLKDGLVVLCDTDTDGGGWLVFQRRVSADVDFYIKWANYKYGFGDIKGNFWLGNEKIHRLTFLRRYELRVDFTFNGKSYFAQYSKFRILGEAEKYKLDVGGYSGNAGDSLRSHNGMAFTTRDRDNDLWKRNCAISRMGAWWYNDCSSSHLNGQWGSKDYGRGLTWESITGPKSSVTSVEMKIRAFD